MSSLAQTLDLLHLFGDPTRVRLVALLARHELTVAELTGITELAQSRVSTHLGRLKEAGVLRDRRNGASTVYAVNDGAMPADARKVWTLLEAEVDDAVLRSDGERADALVSAREKQAAWPDTVAGQMERHWSPGRTWDAFARAFLGLARLGDVLDGGSGDGVIAQMVAPRARTVTCLDRSERVLAAARARLATLPNVRVVLGDLEGIPTGDAEFDHVLLFNVLTSARTPARVLSETARVLRPGGGVTIITLAAHRHLDQTAAYGHVHPGFAPAALRQMLTTAGLAVDACDVTSRERRQPHFEVITAFATRSS
ncbi:MAG TPA: metalloregulator ArsR/SmtB family transcription factor [Candidatus Binatia bacterium]|jgi:ArsR family transcriptional regulator|nr:metalloregulator ArsR/SmtB family transcription factor [Candidatus Binatia bacterium]